MIKSFKAPILFLLVIVGKLYPLPTPAEQEAVSALLLISKPQNPPAVSDLLPRKEALNRKKEEINAQKNRIIAAAGIDSDTFNKALAQYLHLLSRKTKISFSSLPPFPENTADLKTLAQNYTYRIGIQQRNAPLIEQKISALYAAAKDIAKRLNVPLKQVEFAIKGLKKSKRLNLPEPETMTHDELKEGLELNKAITEKNKEYKRLSRARKNAAAGKVTLR